MRHFHLQFQARSLSRATVLLLLLVLFVGTLMPGNWKSGTLGLVDSPLDLAGLAHVLLFAGLAFMLPPARWWALRAWHVPALGLGLALLTEGLQFFAVDRHPNLAGVLQDLCGTLLGWMAAAWRDGGFRVASSRPGARS